MILITITMILLCTRLNQKKASPTTIIMKPYKGRNTQVPDFIHILIYIYEWMCRYLLEKRHQGLKDKPIEKMGRRVKKRKRYS